MTISAYTPTKNYADGSAWTKALMDAFVDGLDSWIASEIEGKTPDKTGTETISGTWTFSVQPTLAGLKLSTDTVTRSDNDVWTLGDYGAQNFVGDTSTQTLTNKSLTSPILTGTIAIPATNPPPAVNALTQGSIVKGWACIQIAGGTPTLLDSYNVSSLGDNGAGDTTINWDTDFSSVNYVVQGTALDPNGTDPFIVSFYNKLSGSVQMRTRTRAAGTLTDNINIDVVAFGDQ